MIKAKIIADSTNPYNERITTFELEYPRFIHSEVMTHRVFSRNASSSRAIPIWKMIKQVWFNMAFPIHWGKKQRGMQANSQLLLPLRFLAKGIWWFTGILVSLLTLLMMGLRVHKQVANRMLEPWTHIKVVLTTTKYDNFFNLRLHKDAQPEIFELAKQMDEELANSRPKELQWGDWHLPYVTQEDKMNLSLEDMLKISASCSAQVSYRVLDQSTQKARKIYEMLVKADVMHASPFEHPARATKAVGTGNFTGTGWTQLRYYIEKDIDYLQN